MFNSLEMQYERLILKIWDKTERMDDPYGLADADLYDKEIKTLGKNLVFSLESGIRRLNYKFQDFGYTDADRLFTKELLQDFFSINSPNDFDRLVKRILVYLEKKK